MLSSISSATLQQYSCTYRLWWDYCYKENVSVLGASAIEVINFLQYILDTKNHRYGTFNSHRSALSLILPNEVGSDLLTKRFLRGISRKRPTEPKYDSTWDPSVVLQYLKNSKDQSLKFLSQKLATLLALTTGGRLQTISLIKLSNISEKEHEIQIFITDIIKTSLVTGKHPCLHIPFFVSNPTVCVATTLNQYLKATESLRGTEDYMFITYSKPHKRASKQTISRWVKDTLRGSGVDVSKFKPHSTRHSATSAARRMGVSTETICKTAGWSTNSATFARFYNRPLTTTTDFANAVLNLTIS